MRPFKTGQEIPDPGLSAQRALAVFRYGMTYACGEADQKVLTVFFKGSRPNSLSSEPLLLFCNRGRYLECIGCRPNVVRQPIRHRRLHGHLPWRRHHELKSALWEFVVFPQNGHRQLCRHHQLVPLKQTLNTTRDSPLLRKRSQVL